MNTDTELDEQLETAIALDDERDRRAKQPTIEEMKSDLLRLGWKPAPTRATIWKSPTGKLYFGPHQAWRYATGNLTPPK